MDVPRLWRSKSAFYRLEGVRCRPCGAVAFPPREVCPACRSSNLGPEPLSGQGEVYSHARVYSAPDGSEAAAPYDVALVRLAEGPLVAARLTDYAEGRPAIGDRVEMVTRRLGDGGPEGVVVYAYAFRPPLRGDDG